MAISVGTKAPDFTLKSKTADGLKDVTLSANFGQKNTLLLFFPLAFTGVCTQEMCDISGGLSAYTYTSYMQKYLFKSAVAGMKPAPQEKGVAA